MTSWINAIIKNEKSELLHFQFENEEELRYFLACNEDMCLIKAELNYESKNY